MPEKRFFIITIVLILLLHTLGVFKAIDDSVLANYIILNKKHEVSSEIVIIDIDHNSINRIGNWPWKRSVFYHFFSQIKDYPSVIGMTISFTETQNIKEDLMLQEMLDSMSNLVFISKYQLKDIKGLSVALPEKSIFHSIKEGHGLVTYSDDGLVTSFQPFKKHPAFSLLVSYMFYKETNKDIDNLPFKLKKFFDVIENDDELYSTGEEIFIDYKRTPEQFENYSFADLYYGDIPFEVLKDKIVLIGMSDKFIARSFITPFTGSRTKSTTSTSVELQAQIIDSLLDFRDLQKCPEWLLFVISILLTISFFFLVKGKKVITQGLYLTVFILVFGIMDYYLFKLSAFWLPPAIPLLLVVLCYGIAGYFTSYAIDSTLNKVISKMRSSQNLPLDDVPSNLTSKVSTLTSLLEIINNDREAIKAIMDAINLGLIVFDENGSIIWSNDKVEQVFPDMVILNFNIKLLLKNLNFSELQLMKPNELYKNEFCINNKDYTCIFNLMNTKERRYVVLFNDITELKDINKLKTRMVQAVSHELRTPLNAILGFAQSLQMKYFGPLNYKQEEYIGLIRTSGEHLLSLINNILDINKIDSGAMEFYPENIEIKALMDETVSFIKDQFIEKNIDLSYRIDEQLNYITCDHRKFNQIMLNLLSNALKYTPKGGKVFLDIVKIDNKSKISVTDTGMGIPEDKYEAIFSEFYQLDQARDQALGGTGIGLALTKRLVLLHGGEIGVNSTEGSGSTFWFILPLEQ